MKCLVSGATGFIGRPLCQQLVRAGHDIVALSKGGAALPDGTPTTGIDLSGNAPDCDLLQGVDTVIHLAGIAHQQAQGAEYQALNVEGTRQLAAAAAASGVKRFIFLSSVKAMGPADSARVRTEIDCLPPIDPYGLSKLQAEQALKEQFTGQDMSVFMLRPALVYGVNAKGNLQRLARGVRRGLPRPPAAGARSMLALDDLVALLAELAATPLAGIHTWIACGEHAYSTRMLYDLLRKAAGRSAGLAWLPPVGWRLGARLLDLAQGLPSGTNFEKLFASELYSSKALQDATGWRPQVSLEQVVAEMVASEGAAS